MLAILRVKLLMLGLGDLDLLLPKLRLGDFESLLLQKLRIGLGDLGGSLTALNLIPGLRDLFDMFPCLSLLEKQSGRGSVFVLLVLSPGFQPRNNGLVTVIVMAQTE